MTVSELIEKLRKYPPDMHVVSHNHVDEVFGSDIWETEVMYFDGDNGYRNDFWFGKIAAKSENDASKWKRMLVLKLR